MSSQIAAYPAGIFEYTLNEIYNTVRTAVIKKHEKHSEKARNLRHKMLLIIANSSENHQYTIDMISEELGRKYGLDGAASLNSMLGHMQRDVSKYVGRVKKSKEEAHYFFRKNDFQDCFGMEDGLNIQKNFLKALEMVENELC